MEFTFNCPACEAEIEVEIEIDHAPVPASGMSGPPEYSSPGEGAEWHLEKDVICPNEACGKTYTAEDLPETEIQERIEEYYSDSEQEDY